MQIQETNIADLKQIKYLLHEDSRGDFCKVYNDEMFKHHGLDFQVRESFYSFSHQGVVRGMHFQLEPNEQAKIIFVPKGKILDVAVDLRKDSASYGKHFSIELSADNNFGLYIPKGFAHGFQALENDSLTFYLLDNVYEQDLDTGIRYDSLGIDWPLDVTEVSMRDESFETFSEFQSPG